MENWERPWEEREGWAAQALRGAAAMHWSALTPAAPTRATDTAGWQRRVRSCACRSLATRRSRCLFFPGLPRPGEQARVAAEISRAATSAAIAMASQSFPSASPAASAWALGSRVAGCPGGRRSGAPSCVAHPCRSCRRTAVPCTCAATSCPAGSPARPMDGGRTNQQPQTPPRGAGCSLSVSTCACRCRAERRAEPLGIFRNGRRCAQWPRDPRCASGYEQKRGNAQLSRARYNVGCQGGEPRLIKYQGTRPVEIPAGHF